MRRQGFVLMEVLAYVTLLGVLATAVGVSSRMALNGSSFTSVESKLGWVDQATRQATMKQDGSWVMTFDLVTQDARLTRNGRALDDSIYIVSWKKSLRLQQVWVSSGSVDLGAASVRYGGGASETFGLEFYDRKANSSHWLLVAGGSGQLKSLKSRAAMKEIFDALSRHDFD